MALHLFLKELQMGFLISAISGHQVPQMKFRECLQEGLEVDSTTAPHPRVKDSQVDFLPVVLAASLAHQGTMAEDLQEG